jgi:hypothetical protein
MRLLYYNHAHRCQEQECTAEVCRFNCCAVQKAKHGAKQPEERRLSVEQLDREKLKDHLLKHKR